MSKKTYVPKGHCCYCERPFNPLAKPNNPLAKTVDHLIPQSKGGNGSPANTADCCSQCNSFKGSLLPQDFLDKVNSFIEANKAYKCIPVASLPVIAKNVEKLVAYVKKEGRNLMRYRSDLLKGRAFLKSIITPTPAPYPTISQINKFVKREEKRKTMEKRKSVLTPAAAALVERLLSEPHRSFHCED